MMQNSRLSLVVLKLSGSTMSSHFLGIGGASKLSFFILAILLATDFIFSKYGMPEDVLGALRTFLVMSMKADLGETVGFSAAAATFSSTNSFLN